MSSGTARERAIASANSSRVLRHPVAERPVLLLDLDKADEDVLAAQAEPAREPVGDRLEERLFLLDRPPLVPGDLDDHQILGAADAEIGRVECEVRRLVLADHLEAVVLRHADADQGLMHDLADFLAVGRVPALAEFNSNKRHGLSLSMV